MKKLLLSLVCLTLGLGSQIDARDKHHKHHRMTTGEECGMVLVREETEGPTLKCPNCPAQYCEAPKVTECACAPAQPIMTVEESCTPVCNDCHKLQKDCGCHKHHND